MQSFETELAQLYYQYKSQLSTHNPSKNIQYTLPNPILNHMFYSFNITHSYFSFPATCPTNIHKFYSPFDRDKIFGSFGTLFQYQWHGLGYAHPHNAQDAQQILYQAQLVASIDLDNVTIITLPDNNQYKNTTPLIGPFPDTHVIAYFPPDTILYEEPTIPIHITKEPNKETVVLHIYYVHHKNHSLHTSVL